MGHKTVSESRTNMNMRFKFDFKELDSGQQSIITVPVPTCHVVQFQLFIFPMKRLFLLKTLKTSNISPFQQQRKTLGL